MVLEPTYISMLNSLDKRSRWLYEDVKEGKVDPFVLDSKTIECFYPIVEAELEYYEQIESPNAEEKATMKKAKSAFDSLEHLHWIYYGMKDQAPCLIDFEHEEDY